MTPTTPSPISDQAAGELIATSIKLQDALSDYLEDPLRDNSVALGRAVEAHTVAIINASNGTTLESSSVTPEEPVLWWNGFRKDDDERDGVSGPSFSPIENTWHDIPLYAGVNPCNLSTAPTTGSAPVAVREFYADEVVDFALSQCVEHTNKTHRFMKIHRTTLTDIVNHFVAVAAAPASPEASSK